MLKVIANVIVFLFLSLIVVAGYSVAAEKSAVTYEENVKQIVSEKCLSCHGSDSPTIDEFKKDKEGFEKKMKGPRMDTYENLMIFVDGKDAGALMRRLDDGKNTKDGKPGNMHQRLGKTDSERAAMLKIIKKWVGGWTLKKKAEMTEEDLKAIKALKE
ncbi:MAG: cytochrome C [Nitrospinae bacterium]|nr:cytochrome C [Nitrospinota bacterium]